MAASPTWTPPADWYSGEVATAAKFNANLRDNAEYLYRRGGASGTAFPTSPAPVAGDRFWRTDLLVECAYDGARWVGAQRFVPFVPWAGFAPFTSSTYPHSLSLTGSIKIDLATIAYYVASPNDTSYYWTFDVWRDSTIIWTVDTRYRPAGSGVWTTTLLATQNASTAYSFGCTKVGSPGGLQASVSFTYRHIYT